MLAEDLIRTFLLSTSFLHFSLFSTALWDLLNSRPVHSLMFSSHLFLCLPCLLPPFTVPCKMVFASPDERETWPYHCSLRLFTIIRRSWCGPFACWILIIIIIIDNFYIALFSNKWYTHCALHRYQHQHPSLHTRTHTHIHTHEGTHACVQSVSHQTTDWTASCSFCLRWRL